MWPDRARTGHHHKACNDRLTGRRSNRTARRLQYYADHSGCSRRQALARDVTNSTTATPRRRATLCGQYDQPWPRQKSESARCNPGDRWNVFMMVPLKGRRPCPITRSRSRPRTQTLVAHLERLSQSNTRCGLGTVGHRRHPAGVIGFLCRCEKLADGRSNEPNGSRSCFAGRRRAYVRTCSKPEGDPG